MQHLRGRHMLTHGQCNFFREHSAGFEPLGIGVQLVGGGSPVGLFPPDLPGFVAPVLKETGQTPVSVNDAWKVITAASELS